MKSVAAGIKIVLSEMTWPLGLILSTVESLAQIKIFPDPTLSGLFREAEVENKMQAIICRTEFRSWQEKRLNRDLVDLRIFLIRNFIKEE